MKALTLWPEWAAAIVLLGKRVENRTWRPPRAVVGQRIAIHAGGSIGGRKGKPARIEAGQALLSIPGVTESQADECIAYASRWAGHVVCTAVLTGGADNSAASHCLPPNERRWCAPGAIGWRLADVQILEVPALAKGKQGLWVWDGAQ